MGIQAVNAPTAPKPVGPYSHAVKVENLLFLSGQIPLDPATGKLVPGDIKAQAKQVLENIRAVLESQGLSHADVVKCTVFMTNLAEFSSMNEVYAAFFHNHHPARSTIQVAALPAGASVEIEVIAHLGPRI